MRKPRNIKLAAEPRVRYAPIRIRTSKHADNEFDCVAISIFKWGQTELWLKKFQLEGFKGSALRFPGGRYVVTGIQLHIRNVKPEDAISRYSCSTENSLTNERRRSSPTKLLVVGKYYFFILKI